MREATGTGGDGPGGMGTVSPPVSLGLYESVAGLRRGEGSVRNAALELVSRWVSGPLDGPKLCKMETTGATAAVRTDGRDDRAVTAIALRCQGPPPSACMHDT